ncbi:MAG: hypothetical protein LBC41_01770 [Clostridiales bacterium]|jgi:hypothetical protein|nr:hypothetical protein [Clostridiales bacterium]
MDTQFHLKTTELVVAGFKKFCDERRLTQSDGFAKIVEAVRRQSPNSQDETLQLREGIIEATERLIAMVNGLQALYKEKIAVMEHERAVEKAAAIKEKTEFDSRMAELEEEVRKTERRMQENQEAVNALAETKKAAALLRGTLEGLQKRTAIYEEQIAGLQRELSESRASKVDAEELKAEIEEQRRLLWEEKGARRIAEAKLESANEMIEMYRRDGEEIARENSALLSQLGR